MNELINDNIKTKKHTYSSSHNPSMSKKNFNGHHVIVHSGIVVVLSVGMISE